MTHRRSVDEATLARIGAPRDDQVVGERQAPDGSFECEHGAFEHYRRTVEATPAEDDPKTAGLSTEGHRRWEVTEHYEYAVDTPGWSRLIGFAARFPLKNPGGKGRWWLPPERLGAPEARHLSLLNVLAIIGGYTGTLLAQTLTFAAEDFGYGDDTQVQGDILSVIRVSVALTVVASSLADRWGRRRLLIISAAGAVLGAAAGAFAPDLWWFSAAQMVSRGFATSLLALILISAAEETPAGCRAYAAATLTLSAALGSGGAVWLLPLADLAVWGWRLIFGAVLALVPLVIFVGRRLTETRRFEHQAERSKTVETLDLPAGSRARRWMRPLALLAVSQALSNLYVAPASQLQNQFLREDLGWTAATIAIFSLVTNTPSMGSVVFGGWLADRSGRRLVGGLTLAVGSVLYALQYTSTGIGVWGWAMAGRLIAAASIPTIAVYGPELFSTSVRGRASGALTTAAVLGSAVGLAVAGRLVEARGFGSAMLTLSVAPAVVGALMITIYPETARVELEALNPEDGDFSA